MGWNEEERKEEQPVAGRIHGNTALAAESLRNAAPQVVVAPGPGKGEERISVFWRVFGGTLLSIGALVVITIYQQMNSSINDLQNRLSQLNDTRGDLVKTGDLSNRMTSVWTSIKDLQTAMAATTVLKERLAVLEQQLKASDDERKDLAKDVQRLQERLSNVEGIQSAMTPVPAAAKKKAR